MIDDAVPAFLDIQGGIAADTGLVESVNPLTLVLPLVAALAISMIVIPVMVRLAPAIGMIDKPDPRKVHARPVPRVGGVGIVTGALATVALLLPFDQQLGTYMLGSLVLFVFGAMDDCHELGHYVKFVGQFIAVIAVVYIGDVYVTHLPLIGADRISESVGKPFTVFAMVGVINAINHSDGLDGLAGGESLLSLCAIAYLAYLGGGTSVTIISLAIIGGLFGFMRFNTYPAVIFMGDSGSQFLGFSLGFLAVLLTQDVNPALSPALPALLLGLPIADIIAVFIQRIYHKMNWFRATRNHIHHRLLDLGFQHYESVVAIYTIQALLVISGVLIPYESDGVLLGLYLGIVLLVFVFLFLAESQGLQLHRDSSSVLVDGLFESAKRSHVIEALAYGVVLYGMSVFLIAGSITATRVPVDLAVVGMVLFGLMLFRLLAGERAWFMPPRVLCYMAIVFVVYLLNTYQPAYLSGTDLVTYAFFGSIAAGIALTIRYTDSGDFSITPTDFLVIIAVLSLAALSSKGLVDSWIMAVALKSIILFYGCELLLNRMKYRWNIFSIAVLVSLSVIGLRGLLA